MAAKTGLDGIKPIDPKASTIADALTNKEGANAEAQAIKLKQLNNELEKYKMGWLGRALGSTENIPRNIAGIVALIATTGTLILLFMPMTDAAAIRIQGLQALATTALGFLFGVGISRKR